MKTYSCWLQAHRSAFKHTFQATSAKDAVALFAKHLSSQTPKTKVDPVLPLTVCVSLHLAERDYQVFKVTEKLDSRSLVQYDLQEI